MLKNYIIGFTSSVLLTLAAFFVVLRPGFFGLGSEGVIAAVVGLAFLQCIVQLYFFLHMGEESKPRSKLIVFVSTVGILFIIIIGSLWIMSNLNYNMTPDQMNSYMLHEEGVQK